jgi:hypothetical protein
MGNPDVTVDTNSDLYIRDKHFKGTRGLWELLNRKRVDTKLVSEDDLKKYKSIWDITSLHFEGYEPGAPSTSPTYINLKLSPSFFLILDDEDSKLHYAKTE